MMKVEQGREFVKRVEADLGHALDSHIIDLFFDNADKLGFTDEECLEVGNLIRADKGMPPVAKWWTNKDAPFNIALHEHLLALGYSHERHEASFEDTGDGETGPMVSGHPAWDEYTGPDWRFFATEMGTLDHQPRDLAFEAFCEEQEKHWSQS